MSSTVLGMHKPGGEGEKDWTEEVGIKTAVPRATAELKTSKGGGAACSCKLLLSLLLAL